MDINTAYIRQTLMDLKGKVQHNPTILSSRPIDIQFAVSFRLVPAQFPLWPKFSILLFLLICEILGLKVSNDGIRDTTALRLTELVL